MATVCKFSLIPSISRKLFLVIPLTTTTLPVANATGILKWSPVLPMGIALEGGGGGGVRCTGWGWGWGALEQNM